MASVTMKGGMRSRVMKAPVITPQTPQRAMPPSPAANMPAAPASTPPQKSRTINAVTTAERAMRLPTLKSMPPVMMTSVMPMARMAITAIWLAMLSRLSAFRKTGHDCGLGLSTCVFLSAGKSVPRSLNTSHAAVA